MKLDTNRLRAALAQEKTAIHCDTLEKAEALFEAMGWGGNSAKEAFRIFGISLCVNAYKNGHGTSRESLYRKRGYTILPLDDFILPDRPRLAEILGVEVGRVFCKTHPDYRGNEYRVTKEGALEWRSQGAKGWNSASSVKALIAIINNPHLIRIIPRWTDADIEDAKAVRRLFPDVMWVAREENGRLWLYKAKPTRMGGCFVEGEFVRSIDTPLFESVTWDNSPVKLEDIV